MKKERGILFVLSGPSGVGKGSVRQAVFEQDTHLKYSISMTTRKKRPGEEEGVDYFFKTKEEFEQLIEDDKLLEYAKYVDNYYGTPREYVEDMLEQGFNVFLEIEVQGALQVRQSFSEGVFIFLIPPNLEELRNRIVARGTETEELVLNRLQEAKKEIKMVDEYDYVVVNDYIDQAAKKILSIIESEECRRSRVVHKYKKLLEVE